MSFAIGGGKYKEQLDYDSVDGMTNVIQFYEEIVKVGKENIQDEKYQFNSNKINNTLAYLNANKDFLTSKKFTTVKSNEDKARWYPQPLWFRCDDIAAYAGKINTTVLSVAENNNTMFALVDTTNILYPQFSIDRTFRSLHIILASTESYIVCRRNHFFNLRNPAKPQRLFEGLRDCHELWIKKLYSVVRNKLDENEVLSPLIQSNVQHLLEIGKVKHILLDSVE